MISSLPLILDRLREAMDQAPAEARPRLLAALMLELPSAAPTPGAREESDDGSELLAPDEAAQIAKVSVRTLLRVSKGQPFRRQLGHRTVRFEGSGLRRWIKTRAGR